MAPTYAPTGGTQAPNPSRAVPAPRPPGVPGAAREAAQDRREARQRTPGVGRGANRPGGRTPAQHIRPGGRPLGGGRPAARTPERMSRNWLNWTPSQIQKFVADRTAESVRSERLPFQQQAGEIEGNARGAAQRLGQAGTWAQGQIGALQQGAEGSAKTFENQVADRAVSAQNAINEQRNQAEKSFGGPLTPGLAGQFVAEQGEAQQSGAAAQRAAGERTQGENNFMRQLREAAAMRATEGQNVVAANFAGQLGKTRAAERAQIGRTETRGQQEYPKMLTAQMNARLGLGRLGVQQGAIAQREAASVRGTGQRERGNIRTTGTSRANAKERAGVTERGNIRTNATRSQGNEIRASLGRESNQIRRSYNQAKNRNEQLRAQGKTASPKEGRKYREEVAKALTTFEGMPDRNNKQQLANVRSKLGRGEVFIEGEGKKGKAFSQDVINAAQAIAYNGRLSPAERYIAESYGMNPQIGGKWFTG